MGMSKDNLYTTCMSRVYIPLLKEFQFKSIRILNLYTFFSMRPWDQKSLSMYLSVCLSIPGSAV